MHGCVNTIESNFMHGSYLKVCGIVQHMHMIMKNFMLCSQAESTDFQLEFWAFTTKV